MKGTAINGIHRKENIAYRNLRQLTKVVILWLMKAIILWLGSYCPEAIVCGRGMFMDNPECLKVSTGGFNAQ